MAEHVESTHAIRIAAPLAQCQRFFTPAGEELWVPDWKPTYLHPADGRTQRGMIFTTGTDDEYTIWSLVDFRTDPAEARYSRVTPGSRAGFVEVRCHADGDSGGTIVEVTYRLTALSEAGARALDAYRGDAFAAMIESWRAMIEAALPRLLLARIH